MGEENLRRISPPDFPFKTQRSSSHPSQKPV